VVLAAAGGRAIRFAEGEIPLQGRVSQGVRGMKLRAQDRVAGMAALRHEGEVVAVTERGFAKRIPLAELPLQKRDGQGNAIHTPGKEMGTLAGLRDVHAGEDLMSITAVGRTLRIKTDAAPLGTRMSEPERTIAVSAHDRVVEITLLAEREPKAGDDDGAGPEGAAPLVVDGEETSLTGPLGDDEGAADPASPEDSPGIVHRVVDQVTGAAAKVLDLFG